MLLWVLFTGQATMSPKIFYNVQSHGNVENSKHILQLLDSPNSLVDFSFDGRVPCDFDRFATNNLVSVRQSNPIIWCGQSQIYQFMDALKNAVKHDGWDYFINLSSACVPLMSQDGISCFLKDKWLKDKKRNFVYGFYVKKTREYQNVNDDRKYNDFKYKNRINLSANDDLKGRFLSGELDPVKNVFQRPGFHCTEDFTNNKLSLRGLSNWEIDFREEFYKEYPLITGRTWVILHRSQVEWLLSSSIVRELYNFYSTQFEPDESFIPSIILNAKNKYLNEVERNNYRLRMGDPKVLGVKDIDECINTQALFARKLPNEIYRDFYEEFNKKK